MSELITEVSRSWWAVVGVVVVFPLWLWGMTRWVEHILDNWED